MIFPYQKCEEVENFLPLLWRKLLLKVCFFSLLSESLLWGKCNFPSSYLKVVREEKYAQRLFKEKRILIEFSAKQTFIHIKEFLITENTVNEKYGHVRPFELFGSPIMYAISKVPTFLLYVDCVIWRKIRLCLLCKSYDGIFRNLTHCLLFRFFDRLSFAVVKSEIK